ncbi:MAG: hypothetical protein ACRD8U_03540 [Pyrinomonadaceae bacterium]
MSGFEVALLAASAAVSAIGAIQAGNAESRAASYNKKLAERNATIARAQGAIAETQQQRDMTKRIGLARANYGASGVSLEGSPLAALSDSASQGEFDRQTLRYNTAVRSSGYQGEANLYEMRSESAQTAGYLSAGRAILLHGAQDPNEVNGTNSNRVRNSGMGFKIPREADPYGYAP